MMFETERTTRRVVVLGLGNVLVGDDALGPWVVRTLESRWALDPRVSVVDGTPGNDLVPHLMRVDAVIVVDTVAATGTPGTIRRWRRDELLRTPPTPRLNPHQPGLKEALLTLDLLGEGPRDVLLVGVVPEVVRTGVGLSPRVRAAIDEAVSLVVEELERLDVAPLPRAVPQRAAVWWEGRATA